MNIEAINECIRLSDEGKITFGQVVKRLSEAGIESYYADLLSASRTYYSKNKAYTVGASENVEIKAAEHFDPEGVVHAIRQIQGGKIDYLEFLRKIMDAGIFSYLVFITGRKVIYFGRRGQQHIEEFPK